MVLQKAIDRTSRIPFYLQLKDALNELIETGYWKPGDRIPGEPELCRIFGVSRTVVRQALQELTYEGRLVRQKGKGTFISSPKITSKSLVHSLDGFYQDMAAKGLSPTAEVLEQRLEPASPKIAAFLQLEPKTPVIRLTRLRFVDEEAIVLVTSYLPYHLCQDLVDADLSNQSLYAFLEERYGFQIARGKRRIDATVANEVEAELFQIDPGSPLMRLESVSYLKDGTPIEYFDSFFRGDRSRFEVEIIGIQGQGKLAEVMGEVPDREWFI